MYARRLTTPLVGFAALWLARPAASQAIDVNLSANQSYTSLGYIRSPIGWRIGAGTSLVGSLGFQAGFRNVSEGGGVMAGYCDAFTCTDGPFDRTYLLRTLDLGLSYAAFSGRFVDVRFGIVGSFTWQKHRLEHLGTGATSAPGEVGPDFGIGAFAETRLPYLAFGIRPLLTARYDRVSRSDCFEDALCEGTRHVATVGLGIAWSSR